MCYNQDHPYFCECDRTANDNTPAVYKEPLKVKKQGKQEYTFLQLARAM